LQRVIREVDEVLPVKENLEKYKKLYETYSMLYKDLKEDFKKLNNLV